MGVDPGSPSAPVFTDVSADAWYRDHVEFLHEACVVNGCSQSPKEYCPNDIVTRIQFGAMLVRSLEVGAFDNCLPDDTPGGDAGMTPDTGVATDTGAPAEDVGSPQDVAGSQDVGEPQPDAAQPAPDAASGGDIGQEDRGSSVAATGGCNCDTSGGGPGGAAGLVVVGWLVGRVWRRGRDC
jgi:MYXO-CTERM domain-containing protein